MPHVFAKAGEQKKKSEFCISSGNRFRLTQAERGRGSIKCPKCGYSMQIDPNLTAVKFEKHPNKD